MKRLDAWVRQLVFVPFPKGLDAETVGDFLGDDYEMIVLVKGVVVRKGSKRAMQYMMKRIAEEFADDDTDDFGN